MRHEPVHERCKTTFCAGGRSDCNSGFGRCLRSCCWLASLSAGWPPSGDGWPRGEAFATIDGHKMWSWSASSKAPAQPLWLKWLVGEDRVGYATYMAPA